MDFYVVADADTVAGFRYVGVAGAVVRNAREAADELERLSRGHERMVVIVTDEVADMVRDQVDAIRFGDRFPLIAEIPGPAGTTEEAPSLLKVINEAVGIKL